MKSFVFVLMFILGLAVNCFADVTSEIIAVDKDENGNIRIWAQYKIDGIEVKSDYPKINEKYVYCTRYSAHNFAGLTDEQIEKAILYQSQLHCDNLLRQEFVKKTISTNDDILENNLKNIVGKTVSKDKVKVKIDDETEIYIKTDGSVSYTP